MVKSIRECRAEEHTRHCTCVYVYVCVYFIWLHMYSECWGLYDSVSSINSGYHMYANVYIRYACAQLINPQLSKQNAITHTCTSHVRLNADGKRKIKRPCWVPVTTCVFHDTTSQPDSQQGSCLMSDMHHGVDTHASVCTITCTQNNDGYLLGCRDALMSNSVGGKKNKTRLD